MAPETLVVLGTGGTIAGTSAQAGDSLGYQAAQVGVAALADLLPLRPGRRLITEQVAQIDSKDMAIELWRRLAARCQYWLQQPEVVGVVITHGTDTLEETAFFLHMVLSPAKPVVLACAMRPADALSPDGPQNLADAVAVAETPGVRGVLVVCAGEVHGAVDVSKVHPYRLAAFGSGDAGVLAHVEAGRLRQVRAWPMGEPNPSRERLARVQEVHERRWPWVAIVLSHAGVDGAVVDALLHQGVDGLIVAGTGNGSVHHVLEAALARAVQRGIPVLRATRCPNGQVLPHAGDQLASTPLSPVKARIALMLDLLA